MDTYHRLAGILAIILAVNVGEITPKTSLESDLGADSLHMAEIVMQIESEFNVEISDAEAAAMGLTVEEVVAWIDRHRGDRS